jgi:8-amino-7-oxononanoate synthase
MQEEFLRDKLDERRNQHSFRELRTTEAMIDFCSNDYLGIASGGLIENTAFFAARRGLKHGSRGSRLLAGNYPLIEKTEERIARFHDAATGLIFNSGYDANIGLLSAVPRRGDTVLYDFLSHASIRDGIRLSFAQSYSFGHNDLEDLDKKLKGSSGNKFVVTESVFSMDGDKAPLDEIAGLCRKYSAHLVVDEAHATGIVGARGEGVVQQKGLQSSCFARVHTFGKALGCHGAIVLGSKTLREYLINFSRAFIFTTALPEASVAAVQAAYELFPAMESERKQLDALIARFRARPVPQERIPSETAIQGIVIPGNERIRLLARRLQESRLDVRPILYPTVPRGSERLRIILHSFNSFDEVDLLLDCLEKVKG